MDITFEAFQARKLSEGYDEVLTRDWAPGFSNEPHSHPFDTDAVVAHGEFWLIRNGTITHLPAGSSFKVARGEQHSERYGSDGAVFWAARNN
jgi:quercetin dioxygenase-like cupin family protein